MDLDVSDILALIAAGIVFVLALIVALDDYMPWRKDKEK